MNKSFARINFIAAVIFMALAGPAKSQSEDTVHGLRQAGWVVVDKTATNEWHKGAPPYEELGRLVYVTIYTLEKEGNTVVCVLTRDLMFDTYSETCKRTK